MDQAVQGSKGSRRSKVENYSRNYACGCGKAYLSYSALYTHIKNKHEGDPPAGTSPLPAKTKRGRPRKAALEDITNTAVPVYSEKVISFESDAHILEEAGLLGVTENGPESLASQCSDLHQLYLHWAAAPVSAKEQKDTHSCDDVFVLYLMDLTQTVGPEGFQQFAECLAHFRKCLNLVGWEECRSAGDVTQQYSSAKGPEDLPNLCNYFIVEYLPQHTDLVRDRAVLFALQFSCWLLTRQYTTLKLHLIDYS